MAEAAVTSIGTGSEVVLEVRIEASPETIYPYFTDPDKMIAWKGTQAELDPTPGGKYRVDVSKEAIAVGEYVELDPPNRLVFTWGWEGGHPVAPGTSTVEVTLRAEGDGTLVRLAHRDLPDEEQRAQHTEGWNHFLERLRLAASGSDPGPDPWAQGHTAE